VVLADPGLVIAEPVNERNELEIALEESVGDSPRAWNGAKNRPNPRRVSLIAGSLLVRW